MGKYDERIARGMALLDSKVPGWVDRIDLDTLKLSDTCNCVIGQVFNADPTTLGGEPFRDPSHAFTVGFQRLNLDHGGGIGHGFNLEYAYQNAKFSGLTRAWKRAIRARREAAS